MPLKLYDNTIWLTFSPLIFFDSIVERVSRPFGNIDPTFSRIPRSLTISEELKNERFVRCERDRDVVEFKHECPTILSVKRPAFLPALLAECKHYVLAMFQSGRAENPALLLAPVFQIWNTMLVNLGLYCKLRFCFESTFLQDKRKQFYVNPRTRKSKLSPVKSKTIHSCDLDHAYAFGAT